MDLCEPRFKNNISFEPIRNRFLVFLNAMWGEEKTVEFLKCLGANDPILMRGQSVRLNLMIAGDHAVQGNNFFYYGTLQRDQHGEKKVPFKAVYEAPILAAGAGCVINRNAPHPHSAALYCDWQLDEKAQKSLKDGYRGTVTLSHAFLPANVELVAVKAEPVALVDKLQEHWKKYVQKRG
jgi:ABC-type Fe3+ transport system substrate-binding protein